jgi:hypothetical protein
MDYCPRAIPVQHTPYQTLNKIAICQYYPTL